MNSNYRKENDKKIITQILKQALVKKHNLMSWQNELESARTIAESTIFHIHDDTQKLVIQFQNNSLANFKSKMNSHIFFKGLENPIVFKAESFQILDERKIVVPLPSNIFIEDKRLDDRFKVNFGHGYKVTFTKEERYFSNKSKSIDLPFFDISCSGMAFKIPASLSRYFYEKDMIKLTYFNKIRMLEPALGEVLYISKCSKYEYSDQLEFRVGLRFKKRINSLVLENMLSTIANSLDVKTA